MFQSLAIPILPFCWCVHSLFNEKPCLLKNFFLKKKETYPFSSKAEYILNISLQLNYSNYNDTGLTAADVICQLEISLMLKSLQPFWQTKGTTGTWKLSSSPQYHRSKFGCTCNALLQHSTQLTISLTASATASRAEKQSGSQNHIQMLRVNYLAA